MKRYFKIAEFVIEKDIDIPVDVADKILNHVDIINEIRHMMGMPIYVSEHSGYRSEEYEIANQRSGDSQHTFDGEGAVDYSCFDLAELYYRLVKSRYRRICIYPGKGFIHCDLLGIDQLIYVDHGSGWHYVPRNSLISVPKYETIIKQA